MSDHPDARMQELQAQRAAREQVRQQLNTAQETLDHEAYRLGTIELALELTQSELDKLESLSMTGLVSSLLGTKAGKIDERRQELEELQREQQECEQAVESASRTVDQLKGRLAGFGAIEDEFRALCAAQTPEPTRIDSRPGAHDFERAVDAGKSLLNALSGTYKLVTKLRKGPRLLAPRGVLSLAAGQVWGNRTAGGVTGQIAGAVRHFCNQLGKLNLGSHCLPDVAVLLPQLEQFADPASLSARAGVDAWAELEVMTKSIVADLHEQLARTEA
jgi:hypothetical protein